MGKPITLAIHETGKPTRWPVQEACRAALDYLCNATSDDFAHGSDRAVRIQLAEALGLDPSDYVL